MTGPASGGTERGTGAPSRTTGIQGAVGAVLVVLALGLALRLIIAYLLPGSGFANDIAAFQAWAGNLAAEGPFGFYERDFFHDYTPGYLYVLWVVGIVGSFAGGIGDLIKVPPIIADLVIGYLVYSMIIELGGRQRIALFGMVLAIVNPISWFDSVAWGQVDSFGVVFVLLGLREVWRDRPERAAIYTVIAAIVKPQLGILVFLVAVVTIRRALWPAGGHGDPARTGRPRTILTTGFAGFATAVVLSIPFGLTPIGLIEQVVLAGGGYPYVTVNAYNPWALVMSDTGASLAGTGQWACDALVSASTCGAGVAMIGPLPAIVVGTGALLSGFAVILAFVARRPDRLTVLVGLALLALAFYMLPTRVHERYDYPFFALGAILAAVSVRWRIAYLVLSVATFANMYVVLTTIYDNPSLEDWLGVGSAIRSWTGVALFSGLHLAAFLWALIQLRTDRSATLAGELAAVSVEPEDATTSPARVAPDEIGESPTALQATLTAPVATATPTTIPAREARMPTWHGSPPIAEVGLLGWIRGRLFARPTRPDRTASLAREGGGRFDRLDLWLLAAIVVAAVLLRTFRLGEPYQMHFDEVYHARTGTEFLQAWRYGDSHDIYEWTHPHLAKYAIAGGLFAWGDDRVSATSELGVPVRDAVIEPRRADRAAPNGRGGERLYAATGDGVVVYSLRTRARIAEVTISGATALAFDRSGRELFIGTTAGGIVALDTAVLDAVPDGSLLEPRPIGSIGPRAGAIDRLHVTDDGAWLVASVGERLVVVDRDAGTVVGTVDVPGLADIAPGGTGAAIVATPAAVDDPAAVAARLADLIDGGAADIEARLTSTAETVVLGAPDGAATKTDLQTAITDGELPGIDLVDLPRVAVAAAEGVVFVDPGTATIVSTTRMTGGAHGLGIVTGIDDTKLYVSSGTEAEPTYSVVAVGGERAASGPSLQSTNPLPGLGSRVVQDEPTQQVHIIGRAPSGDGMTIYVIEPHANAVYADAPLPFTPAAWALDVAGDYPAEDRQQLLVFSATGTAATVEIGQHAFAWRFPGVLAGALTAGLLYLLARILFRRRSVALLAGAFGLADGMLFVQSRIAMNDAYVGLFILAAYAMFAALWMGRWRWRGAFWVAMPVIGLLLGLALSAKWVAAYAIGALALLILARSALGRVLLIIGLLGITAVLGYLAISVPEAAGLGNFPFLLIMIALILVAVVVVIFHPIAWSDDELRIAVVGPAGLGALVFLGSLAIGVTDTSSVVAGIEVRPIDIAILLAIGSPAVYLAFRIAARWGFGPLAPVPGPDDPRAALEDPAPAAEGWLRPGWLLGLPILWAGVCLVAIPTGIYVLSYVPWALIENHRLIDGWPAGNTGQTLADLTGQMYRYHNNLTAPHAASSPWWAWPFDLKPVWFYQEGFAGSTSASIYDAGNLVAWWLGVPAMAFVAAMAFRRRSLALALVAIAFAAQWVSWSRIDRAAFQYHYYTALPFLLIALGYFAAELWHGASKRTWLLARVAAGAAVVAPAAMWLFSRPLCGFVNVEAVNPGSQACPALIPDLVITGRTAGLVAVVGIGLVFIIRGFLDLETPEGRRRGVRGFLPLVATAVLVVVGLGIVTQLPDAAILTLAGVPVEPIAVVLLLPLGYLAVQVIGARDARRFVGGIVVAIVATFAIFYPNISALPLPAVVVNAYQGIIPTYVYAFQFPVNTTDRNVQTAFLSPFFAGLAIALVVTALVVAWSAYTWRVALAEEPVDERTDEAPATTGA